MSDASVTGELLGLGPPRGEKEKRRNHPRLSISPRGGGGELNEALGDCFEQEETELPLIVSPTPCMPEWAPKHSQRNKASCVPPPPKYGSHIAQTRTM